MANDKDFLAVWRNLATILRGLSLFTLRVPLIHCAVLGRRRCCLCRWNNIRVLLLTCHVHRQVFYKAATFALDPRARRSTHRTAWRYIDGLACDDCGSFGRRGVARLRRQRRHRKSTRQMRGNALGSRTLRISQENDCIVDVCMVIDVFLPPTLNWMLESPNHIKKYCCLRRPHA